MVKTIVTFITPLIISSLFLTGCSASAPNLTNSNSIKEAYANSSHTTRGAVIGGAAGATLGYASGVGIIPGTAVGAIFGASYGHYLDNRKFSLREQLKHRGVAIVELGDQILVVVPSSSIFYPMSATVKPNAEKTIQLITRYTNRYVKTLVKVTAYTGDTGSANVDFALSQQQAEAVAKFLLRCHINARLVYAEGCGSTRLVQMNSMVWQGNANFRIEITFEKLPY